MARLPFALWTLFLAALALASAACDDLSESGSTSGAPQSGVSAQSAPAPATEAAKSDRLAVAARIPSATPAVTPAPSATPSPAPTPAPAPAATHAPTPSPAPTATHAPIPSQSKRFIAALDDLDPRLGASASRLPWLGDANQLSSLDALEFIAHGDIDMALIVAESDWFVDGVNYEDPFGSEEGALMNLGNANPDLSDALSALAWLSDDMTIFEASAIRSLVNIAGNDSDLAKRLASSPWVEDGVAKHERDALNALTDLTVWNPELARQIVGYGLDAPVWNRDVYFIDSLHRIRSFNEDGFNRVINSSWFTDGLDDEERAFLTALGYIAPPEFDDLLESRFTLSTTVSLPLSGEVGVWIFHSVPFRPEDDLLGMVEDGARIAESFMGIPLPTDEVIMLVVKDRASIGGFAGYFGQAVIRLSEGSVGHFTVIHEISHFYFSGAAPIWFNEGGAEFIAAYSLDSLGSESWEEQMPSHERGYEYCAENGIGDIHELSVLDKHDHALQHGCSYALGRYFFINLFEAMGESAFSSALREIYLAEARARARDETEYTDGMIYRTFLKHVPPDRMDEFRAVYDRLHGGPLADYERE